MAHPKPKTPCPTCGAAWARAKGECDTCYRYRKRTGKPRPSTLIVRAGERTMGRAR